jgi:PEP-CTERM motif
MEDNTMRVYFVLAIVIAVLAGTAQAEVKVFPFKDVSADAGFSIDPLPTGVTWTALDDTNNIIASVHVPLGHEAGRPSGVFVYRGDPRIDFDALSAAWPYRYQVTVDGSATPLSPPIQIVPYYDAPNQNHFVRFESVQINTLELFTEYFNVPFAGYVHAKVIGTGTADVPEPSSLVLAVVGAVGMIAIVRLGRRV